MSIDLLNENLAREEPCPCCGGDKFWRWPKAHPQHDPINWICWHCAPPPKGSELYDFCTVNEMLLFWRR
jgi:hypothetical protein